ncbi:MAG: 16S rRNA (cytidine(1402)-2'-O)-methyltransferase [Deltaproteobacteria bacterium]|nr:16S rRNA (cytidine(1402)-2'-O)-methyltransferase [Deltaproteobacteria bacterium]
MPKKKIKPHRDIAQASPPAPEDGKQPAAPAEYSASGTLFVVATPIGNLRDITLRALDVLSKANLIAAEDTRHTRKLLSAYDIHTPLVSYHDHNKETAAPKLVAKLTAGEDVALVVSAGTPGISDPGFYLVRMAKSLGLAVVPIPGPCAAVAAMSVSGLPTNLFAFVGFLPTKAGRRRQHLQELKEFKGTLVFYESPGRLIDTMADLISELGDRPALIGREMTKVFETFYQGDLSALRRDMEGQAIKGEITLIVTGSTSSEQITTEELVERLEDKMKNQGLSLSLAVREVAQETNQKKSDIYELALNLDRATEPSPENR